MALRCEWVLVDGKWKTGCGHEFTNDVMVDGLHIQYYVWCPNCGRLVIKRGDE